MLTFVHPWIVLLLPLPWLLRRFLPPRRETSVSVRVPFGDRLKAVGAGTSGTSGSVQKRGSQIVFALIWLLLLAALARPQWLEPPISRNLPTRDLLLLVDLSGSMGQEDFTNATGAKVDRLSAVKEVLGDFLLRRKGDRVGLVVFGDAPFLQAPFSTDLDLSKRLLEETAVGMAGPRTAFGDAIGLGITLFEHSDAPAKTIIALTDGNDSASKMPPIEAARVAKERGIRIYTIAIGDPATVGEDKLDEPALRNVAEASGGRYFFAQDRKDLAGIYDELDKIETRKVNVVSYRPQTDLYYWPLLAGLLLSLGEKAVAMRRRFPAKAKATDGKVRVDPVTGRLEVHS